MTPELFERDGTFWTRAGDTALLPFEASAVIVAAAGLAAWWYTQILKPNDTRAAVRALAAVWTAWIVALLPAWQPGEAGNRLVWLAMTAAVVVPWAAIVAWTMARVRAAERKRRAAVRCNGAGRWEEPPPI